MNGKSDIFVNVSYSLGEYNDWTAYHDSTLLMTSVDNQARLLPFDLCLQNAKQINIQSYLSYISSRKKETSDSFKATNEQVYSDSACDALTEYNKEQEFFFDSEELYYKAMRDVP